MDFEYIPTIATNLINDSLTYINHQLPTAMSVLENRCKNIPEHLHTPQMIRKIYALNKKLIVGEFEKLCNQIAPIYEQERLKRQRSLKETIQTLNTTVFENYQFHGEFYSKELNKAKLRDKDYKSEA